MKFPEQIKVALSLLFITLFIGTVGYMVLSGDTFIDALYMTVITISTVGFGLIHPLTAPEKIFTIFLIILSVSLYGYIVKVMSENMANGAFFENLKLKKMQKKIDSLSGHTIVCGYGRNGQKAVTKLQNYDQKIVIVEREESLIKAIEKDKILYVNGDATFDENLILAGVQNAGNLIVALPSDADNLFIVLTARQMNKGLTIISRASNESSYNKLKIAGANNVIMPDKLGGDHMASLVVVPGLIEFIDNLSIVGKSNINIEEVAVDKLYDTADIKTIRDLDLRQKTGCTVIGFKGIEEEYVVNPEADIKLVPNSKVIVLGRPEQIQTLNSIYNLD
jgi:voltage-gated potassium channel